MLGEGEIVTATPDGITVQQLDGTPVEPRVVTVDWEAEQAQKNGYPHFMLKEIHDQPDALRHALPGGSPTAAASRCPSSAFATVQLARTRPGRPRRLWLGVERRAGLALRDRAARGVRCAVEASSEFRYGDPLVDENRWSSRSRNRVKPRTRWPPSARRRGRAPVIAVTNVVGSALSMESDGVIYMQSGPEICVAATKTIITQMVCGMLLALCLGDARGTLEVDEQRRRVAKLERCPR